MIGQVKIYKSYGGVSKNAWSNSYNLDFGNLETDLEAPAVDSAVNELVAWEKSFHLQSTFFVRAVISDFVKQGRGVVLENTRVIGLSGTGAQPVPNGIDPAHVEATLAVKRGSGSGRQGTVSYRGVLLESDIEPGDGGEIRIKAQDRMFNTAIPGYAAAMPAVAQMLVVPKADSADGYPARAITKMSIGGAASRQRHNNRKRKGKVGTSAIPQLAKQLTEGALDLFSSLVAARTGPLAPVAKLAIVTAVRLLAEAGTDALGAAEALPELGA